MRACAIKFVGSPPLSFPPLHFSLFYHQFFSLAIRFLFILCSGRNSYIGRYRVYTKVRRGVVCAVAEECVCVVFEYVSGMNHSIRNYV